RAVVREPKDHTGQMIVVGLRPAELIVGDARAERTVLQVLQLTASSVVADDDEQAAVGTETADYAVVGAARPAVRGAVLKRVELDQVAIERQRRSVPDESVHAVPAQRHAQNVAGVGAELRRVGALLE